MYRHSPGNLTAKRDMDPAPYPREVVDGCEVPKWKRGQSNTTRVFTTNAFDADLKNLFRVGADSEACHFVLVGDTAMAKRMIDGLPELKRRDERNYWGMQRLIRAFLERLNGGGTPTILYFRERDNWNTFRAKESLNTDRIRCMAIECGSIYLSERAEKGWTEGFGLTLKNSATEPSATGRCEHCRQLMKAGQLNIAETFHEKTTVDFYVCHRCHHSQLWTGFALNECGDCGLYTYVEGAVGSCFGCQLDGPEFDGPKWKVARRAVARHRPENWPRKTNL